jgi:hypothetical protein
VQCVHGGEGLTDCQELAVGHSERGDAPALSIVVVLTAPAKGSDYGLAAN